MPGIPRYAAGSMRNLTNLTISGRGMEPILKGIEVTLKDHPNVLTFQDVIL